LPFSSLNQKHDSHSGQSAIRCGQSQQPQLASDPPESLAMDLTVATVDAIRERLAAIPEKDRSDRKVSQREAIARMTDEILGLRKRGYSWEEVAELVSREGCRVTVGSLKTALWKRGATSRKRARTSASPPRPTRPSQPKSQRAVTPSAPEPAVGVSAPAARTSATTPREPGSFVPREDTKDI
jgi:hypothetical protein